MEKCYGCDAESEQHPILGVMNKSDVVTGFKPIANPNKESAFVGVPVCTACHKDPTHRTVRALKCHFHERKDKTKALVGLVMAGSNDLNA